MLPPGEPENHARRCSGTGLSWGGCDGGGGLPPGGEEEPGDCSRALAHLQWSFGQAYNGQFARGVLVLLGSLLGLFVLIVPGVAIWIWGVYDAYRTAKGMNEGLIPYRETSPLMIVAFVVVWAATIVLLSAASAMLLAALALRGML